MCPSSRYLELVREALHARSVKQVGCFVFNEAASRLKEIGVPILPVLEDVLREEVVPSWAADSGNQAHEFPGLGNVLIAYFQIAKESQMERAAKFLSSLRGEVLCEAFRAISVVWDHSIPASFLLIVESI